MGESAQREKIPALVFAFEQAAWKIAGLTLLDRLIVAIHRAGAGPITVVTEEPLPPLQRTRALGLEVQVSQAIPRMKGFILIAEATLLVQAGDIKRCLEAHARLVEPDTKEVPELLPIGVVEERGSPLQGEEGRAAFEEYLEVLVWPPLPVVEAKGVAREIRDRATARKAQKELWASMRSTADGFVDRVFNRPVGRFLSKILIYTPVSPNLISIASIVIGVVAALFLGEGSYRWALIGALLFQLSAIVDCVDGEIARILFKESPLGKWLDLAGDQIVHISVFAGIAFGVLRNGGGKEAIWLGLSAVIGALISFAVVLRGMRQPTETGGSLQKLIDAATNRDFSVLVLVLALIQKLPWFLWMAGIGSHLFWITALGLQFAPRRQRTLPSP